MMKRTKHDFEFSSDPPTIPTNSSIKTHHTHEPTEISFLRPTTKTTSPSSKMQTTNHYRDLLPQTHDKASKKSKPTIPTIPTNQHISPSSDPDKNHYRKPQTTHMQMPFHLPSNPLHHHTKPSPVGDAIYRFHS